MKEASGELSMTAVAVVAIAAVGGIFMAFVRPQLKGSMIAKTKCQSAYNCTACTGAEKGKAGTKTCTGYYDENGASKTDAAGFTCDC